MKKLIMFSLIIAVCILPVAADALQEKTQLMKQSAVKNMEKIGYTEEEIGQVMNKVQESKMNQDGKMNMYKWMTRLETKLQYKNLNEELENKIQAQNKVKKQTMTKMQTKPKNKNKEGNAGQNN